MATSKVVEIVVRGKDEARAVFRHLNENMTRTQKLMVGIGAAAASFGIVKSAIQSVLQPLSDAIGKADKFLHKMREVNTMMRLSEQEFKTNRRAVMDLSVQYGQMGTVLGQAQYDVASAGFAEMGENLIVLEESARLAVGGATDVAAAADLMTTAMNAYNLSASDAQDVSDALFKTVEIGKTNIGELAVSFGNVAATAALAGVPLNEVLAAIGALAKTIETREAVTAINGLILGLGAASGEAKDKLDELGVSIEDGLAPALIAIDSAGGNALDVLKEFVPNMRALKAAAALGADGARPLLDALDEMKNKAGATQEALEEMMKSPEQMRRRWEAASDRTKMAFASLIESIVIGSRKEGAEALDDLAIAIENAADTMDQVNRGPVAQSLNNSWRLVRSVWDAYYNGVVNATNALFGLKAAQDNLAASVPTGLPPGAKPMFGGDPEKQGKDWVDKYLEAINAELARQSKLRAMAGEVTPSAMTPLPGDRAPGPEAAPYEPIYAEQLMELETDWLDVQAAEFAAREELRNYIEEQERIESAALFEAESAFWGITSAISGLDTEFGRVMSRLRSGISLVMNLVNLFNSLERAASAAAKAQSMMSFGGFGLLGMLGFDRGGPVKAQGGYSVTGGQRGLDTVPILAQHGEEVLSRGLSADLRAFLDMMKGQQYFSPTALSGGRGGVTMVQNFNLARPVSRSDSLRLAETAQESLEELERRRL